MTDAFFDTNLLIYAVTNGERRQARANEALARGGIVSVQVLNEFAAVASRKLGFTWPEVREALASLLALCPAPLALTTATHDHALLLAGRYGLNIYDALIVASALEAACTTLLTEDLQHGLVIEGRLTVLNPFRGINPA